MKKLAVFLLTLMLAIAPAYATQTLLLAAGNTSGTSSTITVDSGVVITASGDFAGSKLTIPVYQVSGANTVFVGNLSAVSPRLVVSAAGTYEAIRPDMTGSASASVAIYADAAAAGGAGSVTQGTSPWVTSISGTVPLPTGAATSAKQDTLTTALGSPFQAGGSIGNTAFERTAIAPAASSAAEACHVIKASAGTLNSVSGLAGQAEYVMLFNATSAPADGAVTPVWWGQTLTNGAWSASWGNPLTMGTGITVCYSSTGPLTKTAISTNNVFSWEAQ